MIEIIRVLQIVDNLKIESGVSSMIMNLYRNIDKTQIQFDFMVSSQYINSYENEIIKLGGNIYYIGNPLSISELIKANYKSKKFFKKYHNKYKIVHLHSPTISEMTIKYAKKYGIKHIIVHSHSTMFSNDKIKMFINKILIKRIHSFATDYWYCSDEAGEFLFRNMYVQNKNNQWIRNGIEYDTMKFNRLVRNEVRQKYNLNNYKVACHISNFSPIKNLLFLVSVIKSVTEIDPNWRFLFVGDGLCRKELEEQIIKENIEKYCIFVGFSNKVNEFLNASDLFLLPSLKEGLPVSAIEAQACGLPCILTNTITSQANIGGIMYLSINKDTWVRGILDSKLKTENQRQLDSSKFYKSRFNISKEAKRVQNLYLTMCD